jgi:hypothetical protein
MITIPITYTGLTPTLAEDVEIVSGQRETLAVTFSFSKDWNAYTLRTAMFSSRTATRAQMIEEDGTAVIPSEVIRNGERYVKISAFGTLERADGEIERYNGRAITLRIDIGGDVEESGGCTDATAYEKLLVRVTALEERVDNIPAGGGGGGSSVALDTTLTKKGWAADAKAVGDALAKKVGEKELDTAVETALAEAKESGEFDGPQGNPGTTPHIGANGNWWTGTTDTGVKAKGDDYVLTDADKAAIAEEAAGMVDVPEKLPNPNALTFSGAVTGTYDGSAPLNVVIPSGGGGTGGASVELDSTLTQPGKAADAKAVGDAIAVQNDAIEKKLDADELPAAVETALEEAKESGEFDGPKGDPGTTPHIGANGNWWIGTTDTGVKAQSDDYVLTDADKTEIAEEAAGMVDVPEKLPNPNALTFSGAVSGTYDGSEPLTVEIPSGGGGGTSIELDDTLTVSGKAADAKAVGDALSSKADTTSVPNSAAVNADNELVVQRTDGDAVAELFKVALPAGGGGGGAEVTMYQNVPSIPLTNGAQYIFYASEAGTITVTFPDEKWGAFNSTISLNAAGICKWYIWVQTGDTAGSFISVDGTRNYKEFKSTVPEDVSLSSTCSNFIVLKLG